MAEGETHAPGPFDVQTIKYLVRLMARHDLTAIELRQGDQHIRLRRGSSATPTLPAPILPPTVLPMPTIVAAAPPAPTSNPAPAAAEPVAPAKKLLDIKSPTPGTFYGAANPESDPFVRVGARVQPNTVVCIIEAMKVFNEITADCSGVITEILAENQQPVEYGQVLFKVDPAG